MDTVGPHCHPEEYGRQKCLHNPLYTGFNIVVVCTKYNSSVKVFRVENFISFTYKICHFVNWRRRKVQFRSEYVSSKINR